MDRKDSKIKRFKRAIARYMFFITKAIIKRTPYSLFKGLAKFLVVIGHLFMFEKRKLALLNLQTAFEGQKTDQELKEISSRCFNNMARGMIDLMYFLDHPDLIRQKVSIEGKENLDEALKGGHGVIVVGAHFGIFILMYIRIIQEGFKTNVIMRRTRDEQFEAYISDLRKNLGINTIYATPARKCIEQSLRALRNNELLFILLDQNFGGEGGVFVDFFGRQAATAAGPVVFSNRTKAAVIPMFIAREPDDCHKIIIGAPIKMDSHKEGKEAAVENVSRITKVIEKYVKLYPHEWGGWMHERWKTKLKTSDSL